MLYSRHEQNGKAKKSLLMNGLRLMLIVIMVPLAASLLFFFAIVSRQMRTQAQHMTAYYTDQLVKDTAAALRQAQSMIYFAIDNDVIQSVMSSSQTPSGTQKELVQQEIGKVTLFNPAWDEQYIHSIFLFRDDGTVFPASRSGIYQAEYARLETVFRIFPDQNSTQRLITLTNNAQYSYMIVDYNAIKEPEPPS